MKHNIFIKLSAMSIILIITLFLLHKFSFIPSLSHSKTTSLHTNEDSIDRKNITSVISITTEQDFENLKKHETPSVVKIYADWCGGCQYVETFFPYLAEEFKNTVHFYTINSDNEKIMNLLTESKLTKEPITYLPTFLLLQSGTIKKQITGVKEFAELKDIIKNTFNI